MNQRKASMRFVAPVATPKGFARRVPPAIFPPILGLFGLGLAWRRAGVNLGVAEGIGEAILGAATLLFLVAFGAYLAKFLRRPAVVMADLRLLPGRLGISAMIACLYLLAAACSPHAPESARLIVLAALGLHGLVIALILWGFVTGPKEQRRYSPAGHLYFVSPIIGAWVSAQAGFDYLALGLLTVTLVIAVGIWAWGADRLWRNGMPAPLRPLLALHLAPAALAGLTAHYLGLQSFANVSAVIAAFVLGALVIGGRWITTAGFSPFWAAFTFPLAATASLWILRGGSWQIAGMLALATATVVIPVIAFRILKLWAGGQLAVKTNAASA